MTVGTIQSVGEVSAPDLDRDRRLVRAAVDGRWEKDHLVARLTRQLPLLLVWARREFRIRYRQSGLGLLWSVIQPLSTLAIYGAVLSGVLHVSSEGFPYISFAYAGLVPWAFTSTAIAASIPSLMNSGAVVGKVYFPREVIPLATVGASVVDLGITTAIFLVILGVQGVGYSIHLIALVPIFVMLILWVAVVAIFGSVLTVFMRDLRYAVGLILQLLFFATPIMYPPTLLHGSVSVVSKLNPLAVAVTAVRSAALAKHWPDWSAIGVFGLIALGLYFLVISYVRSVEPRIVDVL